MNISITYESEQVGVTCPLQSTMEYDWEFVGLPGDSAGRIARGVTSLCVAVEGGASLRW